MKLFKTRVSLNRKIRLNGVILAILMVMVLQVPLYADSSLDALEINVLGQKFTQDPLTKRVARLESAMHQTPLPHDSLSLRLSRLYQSQSSHVSVQSDEEAIRLYNQGIDEGQKGQFEKAITDYQQALRHDPKLMPAYNNLGNLLEHLSKFPEAIQVYQQALKVSPQDPLLYRNLGIIYEKVGNIQQALAHYRQYLKLTPTPDPTIMAIIQNYDSAKQLSQGVSDYADMAMQGSQGEKLIWPKELNPIPVFIYLDPDQTPFLSTVQYALNAWEKASMGRLRFKEVGNPEDANIRIRFREGPLAHPNMEVGQASYDIEEDKLKHDLTMKVSVVVNTGERNVPIPLDNRLVEVRRLALHEIGHALGIWGHSPDPDDIMYSHPIVSALSPRDVRTIQRLYSVENGRQDKRSLKRVSDGGTHYPVLNGQVIGFPRSPQ